jgi:hypothetical protein
MSGITFTPTPIFYLFVGLMIGMLIGWAIGFFDSNSRSAQKIRASELKAEKALDEAKEKMAQAEKKMTSAPAAADDPGLLRLKNINGRYVIELDGVPVTGVLPADRKKRLVELITVFRPHLDASRAPEPASVQPAVKKPEAGKNLSRLSIVEQIDSVLRERLIGTPLEKNGVRLQESLAGGVEVYVGLQKYHTIDDVPDESIKTAIRAAIEEWERKFTPGM